MIVMIDNYDSFTYNLVQYLQILGTEVRVVRNDQVDVNTVVSWDPAGIVISPGQGRPENAGLSVSLIQACAERIPILGVCLGHQAIGQAFGGRIVHAREIMHGKTSMIRHKDVGVFAGLENPFEATRYHSLVIEKTSVPDCLEVTAWTETAAGSLDEIMGVRHSEFTVEGVQFHPESILTRHGHDLLRNFLSMSGGVRRT